MDINRSRIVYVDDEKSNLMAFQSAFEDEFEVITANSASHAMQVIQYFQDFPIIVSDQKMPDMSGIQFLSETKKVCPDAARILISAYTDREYLLEAINSGQVSNYIVKPWEEDEVRSVLRDAKEKYELIKENRKLVKELTEKVDALTEAHNTIMKQEKLSLAGNLISGLSHEIRNLLMPVTLLEITDFSNIEETSRNVHFVIEGRNRIIHLVDEIRSLVRNEQIEYQFANIEISNLISESIDLIRMSRSARGIEIITDLQYDGKVHLCRSKILQVLINLIKNSIEAMENAVKKQIKITVSRKSDFILFSVADTGKGMTKEQMQKIWEPFFTTKGDLGTGVGLGICRNIISSHNGRLHCTSSPGEGTEFIFSIPTQNNEI